MPRRVWIAIFLALVFTLPASLGFIIAENSRNAHLLGDPIDSLNLKTPHKSPEHILDDLGFVPQDIKRNVPVPRVYLTSMPGSLNELPVAQNKRLFTATILPLILYSNELITDDRKKLEELHDRFQQNLRFSPHQIDWLKQMLRAYRVRLNNPLSQKAFDELLLRVDTIPPSLALAQAAIESGWGTSRFVQQGNAIYGQLSWDDADDGIVPEQRDEGKTHKIKAFEHLLASVRAYSRNLNTHKAYQQFRLMRAHARHANEDVSGQLLVHGLIDYSERKELYVEELEQIIRVNRFARYDEASLTPKWWNAGNAP